MCLSVVETPYCPDKNGAEGPLSVHATSNVLDSV